MNQRVIPRTSKCRSCGAPIIWLKLNGRPHPCETKQLVIVTDRGDLARGHESHFATCPHAKDWRQE